MTFENLSHSSFASLKFLKERKKKGYDFFYSRPLDFERNDWKIFFSQASYCLNYSLTLSSHSQARTHTRTHSLRASHGTVSKINSLKLQTIVSSESLKQTHLQYAHLEILINQLRHTYTLCITHALPDVHTYTHIHTRKEIHLNQLPHALHTTHVLTEIHSNTISCTNTR